jgi:hypothetical protein
MSNDNRIEFDPKNPRAIRGEAELRSGDPAAYLRALGCPAEIAQLANLPSEKAQVEIRAAAARGEKVADWNVISRGVQSVRNYSAKAHDYVVETFRRAIQKDQREIDALNRQDAARIAETIRRDDTALRTATANDDELRRKMQIANGRMVK